MAAVELYCKGAKVWLPDLTHVWRVAEIVEDFKDGILKLEYQNGEEGIEKKEIPIHTPQDLPHLKNPEFLIGENDLTSLSYLHEPAVLHSLQIRFERYQAIYTYCGIVLVAVNPYEELPIYGNDIVLAYRNKSQYGNLDPHIFAVAEEAYTKLERENRNQSIIVSGESGAGKTVSAKYAMRYFATAGGSATETQVEKKVLASNPIMEAIGNAKTTRNDNSSRFGKYIEIDFNSQYHIMGANMRTYLLEKSRVVFQSNQERNYHIFYQLCAAASLPEYQDLRLDHQDSFHYTNQGGSPYVDGVNDLEYFIETKRALSMLGFPDEFQKNIFRILGAILHLGNVQIQEADQESCTILRTDTHLDDFCHLMGLANEDKEELRKWLCFRQIVSMREVFTKPVNLKEAIFARDALAKHIYSHLFNKIVSLINKSLASNAKSFRFIGVLDIYGFETFQINSFEQFCINYANEKLQQQFNQHVFKLEQEEYVRENIEWTFIEFYDNQPCIDLIENKLGILDLLDEECKFPKGSDQSWVSKLYDKCKPFSHFSKPRLSNTAFIITHFADKVEYQCEGFVEKNRDTVMEEQVNILRHSKNPLVLQLVSDDDSKVQPSARMVTGTAPRGGANLTVISASGKPASSTTKHNKKTVGSQFRDSLTLLMNTLNATTPHYIRCIKPNDLKEAFVFDPHRAVQQLRACGVLETVRISAAGFPSRYPYEDFFARYRVLFKSQHILRQDVKASCQNIIALHIKEDKFKFGKTKIFFRAGEVAYLEKLRLDRLRACGVMIQKCIRGWYYRQKYLVLRKAAICGQRLGRGFLARKRARAMRENRAAIIIQRNVRMFVKRQQYKRLRCLTITLQAHLRGALARQRYLAMVRHSKAIIIQRHIRGWLARRRFVRTMRGILLLQCCWRRYLAKKLYKSLRVEARSIEHVKKLNKGLENKIISLQQRIDEMAKDTITLRTLQSNHSDLKVQYDAAKGWENECKHLQVQMANLVKELAELRDEMSHEQDEKIDLVCEKDRLEKHLAEQETVWHSELANLRNELENLQSVLASKEMEAEETLKKRLEEERAMLDQEYDQERGAYQKLLHEHRELEQRCDDLEMELEMAKGSGKRGHAEIKGHVRSLSDVSTISGISDAPPTLTDDDVGYSSVKSSLGRPDSRKTEGILSERFIRSPEPSLKGDELSLVLKLEQRIKTLEKDKLRLIIQLEDLEKERDSPGGEARRAQDLIRLQEVEMENAKLKDDLKSLRNCIATDNKGNLPMPADQLLDQFEALSDELDRRREECIQLRTVLSNHHVTPGPEQSGASQRNSFLPPARFNGDGINEDGELNMVVSTQKMIIRQLEDELQVEKDKHERYVTELKEELDKLTIDNDRQQRLLAQNLHKGPQNQNEAVLQHEVARLMRENLEIRETSDISAEQTFRYKRQLKQYSRKLKDAGVSLETLSDVTIEPKARRSEVPAVAVMRKKDVEYMGMFDYRREDEATLVRSIVYDLKPRVAASLLPGLPAYILFMCIRHTDYVNDDEKVRSLLTSIIGAVKRVIRKRHSDMDTTILWLANTSRLLHSLKQYSGDKAFQKDNSPKQNEQCLRNFDLSEYRQVLSDIAVWIYQAVIKIMEERVQSLVVSAVLEHEAISGLSGHRPVGQGMRARSNSTAISHSASVDSASSPVDPLHAMEALLHELNSFLKAMNVFGVDPPVVTQVFRQLFYFVCASSLNNLLLRKDLCHWSKGMQIRFNLSHLEQWCRDSHIQEPEPAVGVVETLLPIIQAAQLLQARKSEEDVRAVCDMCTKLSSAQIIKILNLYTPADESEERVTVAFIKQVQTVLAERNTPDQGALLMDTKYSFPVRFPYSPSSIKLEDVDVPDMLNLTMLRKL